MSSRPLLPPPLRRPVHRTDPSEIEQARERVEAALRRARVLLKMPIFPHDH
jgi:hypothetical protein